MESVYVKKQTDNEEANPLEIQYNNLLDKKTSLYIKSLILCKNDYIMLEKQFRVLSGYKNAEVLADECQNAVSQADELRRYYLKCAPLFFFAALSAIMTLTEIFICPMAPGMPVGEFIFMMAMYITLDLSPFFVLFYTKSDRKIFRLIILCAGILWNLYYYNFIFGFACNYVETLVYSIMCTSNLAAYIMAYVFPNDVLANELKRPYLSTKLLFALFVLALAFMGVITSALLPQADFTKLNYVGSLSFDVQEGINYHLIFWFSSLMLISLYIYMKILNLKYVSKLKIASAIVFSIIIGIPLSFEPYFYELLILGALFVFTATVTKVKITLMLAAVVISVGSFLGVNMITQSMLIILRFIIEKINLGINMWLGNIRPDNFTAENYRQLIYFTETTAIYIYRTISIAFIYFFFKMKRLKSGFVFLQSKEARWVGIFFSAVIMISQSFWYYSGLDTTSASLFFLVAINICAFGIHKWWQNHTTFLYHQRLKDAAIRDQKAEAEEINKRISALSESNVYLSKAVHRDNKLIPAMYSAISFYLSNSENIDAETKMKGMSILGKLDEMMHERKELIAKINEYKPLPPTGMERADNILRYMFLRASEKGIKFDFAITGSIKDISERVIPKQELETLLADLIENAIVAVSHSAHKKILVTMGIVGGCFEISVQDSGIPFEAETFKELGKNTSTTYRDNGGSGIGYLTIFGILSKCSASLIISEKEPEYYDFSKSIKVCFDGKSEFVIYSYRAEEVNESAKREDMLIFDAVKRVT